MNWVRQMREIEQWAEIEYPHARLWISSRLPDSHDVYIHLMNGYEVVTHNGHRFGAVGTIEKCFDELYEALRCVRNAS